MAKKLTKETLERMVLQVMNESNIEEGWVQDFTSMFGGRGRTMTPSEKLPRAGAIKLGGAQGNLEQLLNMIQLDPKVPQRIKDFAADVLITPAAAGPTVKSATDTEWDLEQIPTANIMSIDDEGEESTSKESEMTGLPSAGGMPSGVSAPGSVGRFDKKQIPELPPKRVRSTTAYSSVAESKLEALIAEVLAEISDKERRDLEAHYGPDMRGAEASKKQLDKIDAAIKEKKEKLKKLKDLKGLRGHYGEDVSGKKQNDKKIAELEKEIKQLEAELGSKKTAKK